MLGIGLGLPISGPIARPTARTDAAPLVMTASGWQLTATGGGGTTGSIQLERAGFAADGGAALHQVRHARTIPVRRAFPDHADTVPDTMALSDYVYASDTVPDATNVSTLTSPKPTARWVMPSRLVVGDTITWEMVAFHRDARADSAGIGRQVACVKVRATNGTASTGWQTVSETVVSTLAEDANPIEVYRGEIDVSALPDGIVWLEAEVYPWLGTAASVLTSAPEYDSRRFARRYFTKDTALAANPPYVYVAPGGDDAAGVCSTDPAVAAATPCLTVAGAFARALAATAVTGGKLDGVHIRIAGAVNSGTFPYAAGRRFEGGGIIVERAPDTTRANAVLTISGGFGPQLGHDGSLPAALPESAVIFRDLTVRRITAQGFGAGAAYQGRTHTLLLQMWNCTFENNAVQLSFHSPSGALAMFGVVFTGTSGNNFGQHAGMVRLHRGVTADDAGNVGGTDAYTIVGGRYKNPTFTPADGKEGLVLYGNSFPKLNVTVASVNSAAAGETIRDLVIVQNLFEYYDYRTNAALRISSDNGTGDTLGAVIMHNTMTGWGVAGRVNLFYDEAADSNRRTHLLARQVGNIFVQYNVKGDVFVGANQSRPDEAPFRTGNQSIIHGVGMEGNFHQFQTAQDESEAPLFYGVGSVAPVSKTVRNDALFVDYRGSPSQYGTGTGGGDYRLQSESPARGIVAEPVLAFDLAGVARNSGAQAAGCHAS